MGLVDKFEKRIERFVNGAFSKAFKSQIQPVELASAVKNKMDKGAAVVDRDRILAPNSFVIRVSGSDFSRLNQHSSLISEITKQVASHAKKQRYQFAEPLDIKIEVSSTLGLGQVQVSASGSKSENVAAVSWKPALDFGGKRYLLAKARTTVGRDATADLQVDDTGLSRTHFAIIWDGSNATVEDLGSTNGTKVAGNKIGSQVLSPDTVIEAGRTSFVFRVVASNDGDK